MDFIKLENELRDLLLSLKIREDAFTFQDSGSGERYCFVKSEGQYEVYYAERGNKNCLKSFGNIYEGAYYFLNILLRDMTSRLY